MIELRPDQLLEGFTLELESRLEAHPGLLGHRWDNLDYDFAALDTGKPRSIEVLFQRPTQQMFDRVAQPVLDSYSASHPSLAGDFERLSKAAFDEHFGAGKAWHQEWREGNLLIRFGEVSFDDNPSAVLQVKINNVPFVIHDGSFKLTEHFTEAVNLCNAFNKIKRDGVKRLPNKLVVAGEQVAHVTPAVTVLGKTFWERAKGAEEDFYLGVLKHERGHVVNGDLKVDDPVRMALFKLEEVVEPLALLQGRLKPAQYFTDREQPRLRSAVAAIYPGKDSAGAMFDELDGALTAITPGIARMAEYVEAYPGFEEMDAFSVAIDRLRGNAFARHILDMDVSRDEDGVKRLDEQQKRFLKADDDGLAADDPEYGLDDFIRKRLEKLTEDHGGLFDHLITLDTAFRHLAHAREIGADLHMVEHADRTEEPLVVFSRLIRENNPANDQASRTHLSHRDRLGDSRSFVESVEEARAENAKDRGRG